MKLSIEQANKLLSALPGDVVVVENDNDADDGIDTDALLANMHRSMNDTLKPGIEEQLKPTLEASFTGRYLGALRSAAQRVFSVPKRELEDMSIEQILNACKGNVDNSYNQTEEERRNKWEQTIGDYETQLTQLKEGYEQTLAAERAKYLQRDIAARCISIIEKLPRKGGDLQEQADMLRYKMGNAYDVQYNEATQQLEFYKDGKAVLNDKNEPLSDEDFAHTWAEKAGILVHDTRHVKPADVKAGHTGAYATGIITPADDAEGDSSMEAIVAWAETQAR